LLSFIAILLHSTKGTDGPAPKNGLRLLWGSRSILLALGLPAEAGPSRVLFIGGSHGYSSRRIRSGLDVRPAGPHKRAPSSEASHGCALPQGPSRHGALELRTAARGIVQIRSQTFQRLVKNSKLRNMARNREAPDRRNLCRSVLRFEPESCHTGPLVVHFNQEIPMGLAPSWESKSQACSYLDFWSIFRGERARMLIRATEMGYHELP
jgi:hypothetical protein